MAALTAPTEGRTPGTKDSTMKIQQLHLLLVLWLIALGACGTFEVESDVLTETQLAAAATPSLVTQAADTGNDNALPTATSTPADAGGAADSPTATPTPWAEPVIEIRIDDVAVAPGETVAEHLRVTATGEVNSNCYRVSGWTQIVIDDRLVAQPIVIASADSACDGTPHAFMDTFVMDQHGFSIEQLAGGSLMLDVAGTVQPLRPLLAPYFSGATPTPTLVPTPDPGVIPVDAFEAMLQEAITTHDYAWMEQLMDDPFDIALWQSQGYTAPAAQAVNDLRHIYLTPDHDIVFGAPLPNLTPVLGPGNTILDIWNPAANAVSAVFTTGWGPDGETEAFLIISVLDDGVVQWDGVIFAPGELGGFDGPYDGQVIPTEAFVAMLEEAINTHNDEWMAQLMDDPFTIGLWQSEGYTTSPTQAVADLRQTYLSPGQTIVFGAPPPDLSPVLGPGRTILDVWDPAANAVSAVFTTGWGPDGETEAFLIINVLDDGAVQWDGIILAGGGFAGP